MCCSGPGATCSAGCAGSTHPPTPSCGTSAGTAAHAQHASAGCDASSRSNASDGNAPAVARQAPPEPSVSPSASSPPDCQEQCSQESSPVQSELAIVAPDDRTSPVPESVRVSSPVRRKRDNCRRICARFAPRSAHRQLVRCLPAARRPAGQWYMPIPQNLTGVALHEACLKFREQCLLQDLDEPSDQRHYIVTFDIACGLDSSISRLINTKVYDATLNWQSPKDYALAMAERIAQQRKAERRLAPEFAGSAEYEQFLQMVERAYPPHEDDPDLLSSLQSLQQQAADESQPYAAVKDAKLAVAMAQQRLDDDRQLHEGRNPMQRYQYLLTHTDPDLKRRGAEIKGFLESQRDLLSLHPNAERERYRPFSNTQVKTVDDLVALTWLINYVARQYGSISEVHIRVWQTRRMSHGQTPRDAYARLKAEGSTVADLSARRVSFDLGRELLDMVSQPFRRFWPDALWERLQSTMITVLAPAEELMEDQESLARLWVDTAQSIYTQMQSRMADAFAKLKEELRQRGPWQSWTQLEDAYHKQQDKQLRAGSQSTRACWPS